MDMKQMYNKKAAIRAKMNCLSDSGPNMWSSASMSWISLYVATVS